MATAAEAQALVTAASCDFCTIPQGLIWYAVLAALIDKGNGNPVPTDPNDLIEEAKCLQCVISEGLLPYALLQAITEL